MKLSTAKMQRKKQVKLARDKTTKGEEKIRNPDLGRADRYRNPGLIYRGGRSANDVLALQSR